MCYFFLWIIAPLNTFDIATVSADTRYWKKIGSITLTEIE